MQRGHLIVHDLGQVDDRLPLAALIARHQGIDSTPESGISRPPSSDSTRSARPARRPVVGDDHQRRLELPRQPPEELVQPLAVGVVQVAAGLVGQDDQRVRRERAGHRRPLLLAARERRRTVGHPPGQPHGGEQLLGPRAGPALVLPGDQQRQHDVLQRGELPEQVMELEHESELPVPHRGEGRRDRARRRAGRRGGPPPAEGASSAPSRWSSVLFPEPLEPTIATNSPRPTSRSTPASTSIGLPSPPSYTFRRPCASRIALIRGGSPRPASAWPPLARGTPWPARRWPGSRPPRPGRRAARHAPGGDR